MPVTKADKNLDGLRFALLALSTLPLDDFLCIDEKLIDTPSLIYCRYSNYFSFVLIMFTRPIMVIRCYIFKRGVIPLRVELVANVSIANLALVKI